ncbi:WD repeat-containing protein 48 [Vanrija pseudolonga]|uniref:WD repeat-containing protein 48 n=1 Tax=Vanrija pseudolonga TaxID=143232 RepID=A0AAF0YBE8_9TREE|nr:WD repeat-containing protein 48 [Vanrija pseudolonga]
MGAADGNKRRVSYVIPAPDTASPVLELPPFGTGAEATRSYPLLTPKRTNGRTSATTTQFASRNPFAPPPPLPLKAAARTHPRHRLGITSLALDTSTVLSGNSAPGGILYTGGRDGLVAAWDLNISQQKRRGRRYRPVAGRGTGQRVRWERIGDGGDWDDDDDDAAGEADDTSSDDDDTGAPLETNGSGGRKKLAYEDRWEVDREVIARQPPAPTTFRESVQTHTDWVNAMVLCNMNQTVITASSDRTIRAWSPHAEDDELTVPALIGHHTDYVRSLAFAKHPGVLFSGSLDRDISVWDINSPRPNEPVLKVRLSDIDESGGVGLEGEWGSIYALGVDPAGTTLAAGTPERVVRLWDPRAGDRSVTKLVGHTECVRSILLSEDGRYMLTGSSDTTIKLWSVGEHRCLHTFNHHTSSVWSLFSNHPNLERFYSGSRDGHLTVVDVEQVGDMSEGECISLAREGDVSKPGNYESKTGDDAIRSITAMDDEFVWTATSSSDVHRWRDVGRRVNRLDLDGSSYGNRYHDAEGDAQAPALSLGAAFEPLSIIDGPLRNKRLSLDGRDDESLHRVESRDSRTIAFAPSPVPRVVSGSSPVLSPTGPGSPPHSPSASALPPSVRERLNPSIRRSALSSSSIANSVASETGDDLDQIPLLNGIPYESLVCLGLPDSPYSFGFSNAGHSTASLSSAMRVRTAGEESPEAATNAQAERERVVPQRVAARRAFEDRDVASEAKPLQVEPDATIEGSPGLIRSLILNDRMHALTLDTKGEVAVWHLVRGECVGRFEIPDIHEALTLERGCTDPTDEIKLHPQEVLELVQRRLEGKNSVLPWCQVDTKVGQITVHLEGDRVFAAEILAEEIGLDERELPDDARAINIGKVALANLFRGLIKAEEYEVTSQSAIGNSPTSITSSLPSVSRSPQTSTSIAIDRPLTSPRHRQRALSSSSGIGITPSINIAGLATRAQTRAIVPDGVSPFGQSAPTSHEWLSLPGSNKFAPSPAGGGATPGSLKSMGSPLDTSASRDYFSMRRKAEPSPSRGGNEDKTPTASVPATPIPSGGSSILGKKFKGFGKKKATESPMTTVPESRREEPVPAKETGPELSERDKAQLGFLDSLRSRPFRPPTSFDSPTVPIPASTAVIISEQSQADGAYIVTYRSQVSSTERDIEPLEMNSPYWLLTYLFTNVTPEERRPPKIPLILLPVGQAVGSSQAIKVQASRTARVRGVMEHLQNVLPAAGGRDRALSDASAMSGVPAAPRPAPEDVIELLCGQHVADPNMKVGTLKHYYWRGGVDMVLHYRVK